MLLGFFRFIRNFVAFVAGMTLASFVLLAIAPFPKSGLLTRKFQHLKDNPGKYPLLYVGSSRVFHEFIPAQFDAALAQRNHPIQSLNFGQDGMWPPESLYMILATRPKGLRWVLIDLMTIKPMLPGTEDTLRSMSWHDTRHTWLALRNVATVPMETQTTFEEKFQSSSLHLSLWAQRSLNAGTGSDRFQIAIKMERAKRFEPLTEQGWERSAPGPLRGDDVKKFNEELAKLRKLPSKPIPAVLREAYDDIVAEVRAAGAEPIFVVASNFIGRERFTDWPPAGVTVFRFDDPDKFPELYNPDHRSDVHHLDPTGAVDFTRLLADRFAEYLQHK